MNTIEWTDRLVERIADRSNPILVKETRQSLKSRQFVGAFMLLLAAAWLIAVFGVLDQGSALEYGNAGRDFFFYFYIAVAVATLVIVPFSAFRSLQGERDFNTFELLSITTLSPREIVWGKLWSAAVQLLIFYSAVTPFIAFSSMLQGFDVPRFVFVLAASMVVSLILSMAALMTSTLGRQRMTQGLMAVVTLFGLASTCMAGIAFVGESVMDHPEWFPVNEREFWEVTGVLFVAGLSYFVLFQQVTVAQLTFESDNHSTGVRLVTTAQFLLLWGGFFALMWYKGWTIWMESLVGLALVTGLHWAVFGGIMATEFDPLSHRVRRGLPRSRALRLLYAPFLPGGGRGYLNLLLQTGVFWWAVVAAIAFVGFNRWVYSMSGGGAVGLGGGEGLGYVLDVFTARPAAWNTALTVTTAICCYLLFYVGVAAALGRWGMALSHEIRPVHARVVGIFVLVAGLIWPVIPRIADLIPEYRFSIVDVTSPYLTLAELGQRSTPAWDVIGLLWLFAAIGVALNARAMWRGLAEVLSEERRRPVGGTRPATNEDGAAVPFAVVEEA